MLCLSVCMQIHTYRTPDYKHKISSKLDTSDPTPSVHRPRNNIDELICDEEIHYHSRYKHSRSHSAPAKHLSYERSLNHPLSHSRSNISNQFSSEHSQNLHTHSQVTESNSVNSNGDK